MILGTLMQLAALFLFLASLAFLGRALREALKTTIDNRLERFLWDSVLGTTAAAMLVGVGGLFGLYRLPYFLAVLALGPLLYLPRLRRERSQPSSLPAATQSPGFPDPSAVAGLGVCALAVFLAALLPESFYDSVYYHLGLPSQYLLQGKIAVREAVVHSAFPAYHDSLLGVLLAFGGAPMARLFTCVIYLFGGAATCVLGRILFGTGGTAAAFLLMSVPGVMIISSMTNVDTAILWYSAMTLAGTARALESSGAERRRWALLAAVPLGMAIGSKYTGLFFLPVPALALAAAGKERRTDGDGLRAAALLTAAALLVASPWYLRNLIVYGNPFFPALDNLFGPTLAGGWALENLRNDLPRLASSLRDHTGFWQLLSSGRRTLGVGAEPGWGAALIAPAALAALFSRKSLRVFLPGTVIFLLLWAANHAAVRYLFPLFPLLAACGGWGVTAAATSHRGLRFTISLLLAGITIANLPIAGRVLAHEFGGAGLVAARLSGRISGEEYLSARLPYYKTAQWMNANIPRDTKILFLGETRVLYVEREVSFSSAYDFTALVGWIRASPSVTVLRQFLAAEGIGYILVNASEVRRLNASYRYMKMTPGETAVLNELLQQCTLTRSDGDVHLFRLPEG